MSNGDDNGKLKMYEKYIEEVYNRIKWTFRSILVINWILVAMGVAAFVLAVLSAAGGKFEVSAVFSAIGGADVISVFRFAMDRVQRSLGDQVQVQTASDGYMQQMNRLKQLKSIANVTEIDDIAKINEEVRRATLYSMELIQDFTKMAEPLRGKPWIRALPIRYSKLKMNGSEIDKEFTIYEGEEITLSGSLQNVSNKRVRLNAIVIAVRPPMGTPDGGPFRFDFHIDERVHILMPYQSLEIIAKKKSIEKNAKTSLTEGIRREWYTKDWYAFMTCQTEDGCWWDDHNKYWFEVKKPETTEK